jgi:hypothetical protein
MPDRLQYSIFSCRRLHCSFPIVRSYLKAINEDTLGVLKGSSWNNSKIARYMHACTIALLALKACIHPMTN